jgi:cardiolipin synthase
VAWALIGIAFLVWLAMVVLFAPRIDYHVVTPLQADSDEFLDVMQSICLAAVYPANRVEILTNGTQFYPAMRDAIRAAEASVNLEAYIMHPGAAADMLIEAMAGRGRAGVEVRVVLDAIGSLWMGRDATRALREAGCQLEFYQPIRWHRLHRLNNRTHRELLVVDGRVAFTGGAGIADWWHGSPVPSRALRLVGTFGRSRPTRTNPAWRDTMVRIEGPLVAGLQGVFAENWLECRGEILTSPRQWPPMQAAGRVEAMLAKSSPSDRVTTSRVVFQMLVEGAGRSIDLSTPYFLPDRALRLALVRAARRGVRVRVMVPGAHMDQRLVRLASRRMYGDLLAAGVRLYEYRPSMTHVKTLLVDNSWAVVGTTNVDNRSFEHNDEINVAFRGADVASRLRDDFEADLAASEEVTLASWRDRPLLEKIAGPVCWILERQQ